MTCVATLRGHTESIYGVSISADGRTAVSGSVDGTVRVWRLDTFKCVATLKEHTSNVRAVAVSADGKSAVSGSWDKTMKVWCLVSMKCMATMRGHTNYIRGVSISADGKRAVSCSSDDTVKVWDLEIFKCVKTLEGHKSHIFGVALSADGNRAVSVSGDKTLKIWDLKNSCRCVATLEGHTNSIHSVAITPDGGRAISGGVMNPTRVWDLETGECIAQLDTFNTEIWGIAITADGQRALTGSFHDSIVYVWDLPPIKAESISEGVSESSHPARYTNAKVLFVGDSGAGKTGLSMRLTTGRFDASFSTDGAWATQLALANDNNAAGIEREIWMWDFGGQADYRLTHQLFMDETAMAVFVFNPQSDNPFEGLAQWDKDIKRAARGKFKKLLVAGRCDRGGIRVSRDLMDKYARENGFSRYIETSAKSGDGCEELYRAIVDEIDWDRIPWMSSPETFKRLKNAIIRLKNKDRALLRIIELQTILQGEHFSLDFTVDELRTVVALLAGPGAVWKCEFGDYVLLRPEQINLYAAAMIRKVRAHVEEIGCIPEKDALAGDLDYKDMKRLPRADEEIVIRAMHETFVARGLCFREETAAGTMLVFPSYFRRERPELSGYPAVFVTYSFVGSFDAIYATLVVKLIYTMAFKKENLWRYAVDFKTHEGKTIGLKMTPKNESSAEIVIFFAEGVPDDTKVTFVKYVHEHLLSTAENVTRTRHYVCPKCHTPVEDLKAIKNRLGKGFADIGCQACDARIKLKDIIETNYDSDEFKDRVRELDTEAGIKLDNESLELILVGHAFAIAGEAGQIFRPTANSDHGIDGEIEFKNDKGEASGQRVYLQLKSGDSYLRHRKSDDKDIFDIGKPRHVKFWKSHAYPVMLVIRTTSDGKIRWMNVTDYLRKSADDVRQIIFEGEPFTADNLRLMRNRILHGG
jgi:small GTP-binding protein